MKSRKTRGRFNADWIERYFVRQAGPERGKPVMLMLSELPSGGGGDLGRPFTVMSGRQVCYFGGSEAGLRRLFSIESKLVRINRATSAPGRHLASCQRPCERRG